jgi:hypothetical protein
MNSGVRRTEEWTLYDEQDRPVVVTALVIVFAGSHEVKHWQSGRTADGRRLKPYGAGAYITDDGKVLTVLPTAA